MIPAASASIVPRQPELLGQTVVVDNRSACSIAAWASIAATGSVVRAHSSSRRRRPVSADRS